VSEEFGIPFGPFDPDNLPENLPEEIKELIKAQAKAHAEMHDKEKMQGEIFNSRVRRMFNEVSLDHLHTLLDVLNMFDNLEGEQKARCIAYFLGSVGSVSYFRHEHESCEDCGPRVEMTI
jgi:hypothetical protein